MPIDDELAGALDRGVPAECGELLLQHLGLVEALDDVALAARQAIAVIDAKYKRLLNSCERPTGVDPADLYQIRGLRDAL